MHITYSPIFYFARRLNIIFFGRTYKQFNMVIKMAEKHTSNSRLIIGVLLILVGGLFLLRNYYDFYLPNYFYEWEFIFIALGIVFLLTSKNKTVGFVFIAIGLFNLEPDLWPLLLVGIGAYIMFKGRITDNHHKKIDHHSTGEPENISSDDYIDDIAVFGGGNKVYQSNNFRGGKSTAIFGGSEIDLYNCKLADGVQVLDITAIFGGVTLLVPNDWNIQLDIVPIFGGFGDKRRKDPNLVQDQNKTLVIKGVVLFGGGELKN